MAFPMRLFCDAALPEGDLHEVVLLPEGLAVFLGNRLAGLEDDLNDLRLRGDGHLNPGEVIRPLVYVEVDIDIARPGH